MAEQKTLFPVGRVVLLVGAVLLIVSLFLPWFVIGGSQQRLPAGTYDGVGITNVLNTLAQGPYAWAALAWLILVVVFGVTSAFVGRKFSMFGTSGILVLALYAILIFVSANLINQGVTSGAATVGFAYGFFLAISWPGAPSRLEWIGGWQRWEALIPVALFLPSLGIFLIQYFKVQDEAGRKKIRWVVYSAVTAGSLAVFFYLIPNPDKPEPNRLKRRGKVAQQDGA